MFVRTVTRWTDVEECSFRILEYRNFIVQKNFSVKQFIGKCRYEFYVLKSAGSDEASFTQNGDDLNRR
jgi:hypothetical protein